MPASTDAAFNRLSLVHSCAPSTKGDGGHEMDVDRTETASIQFALTGEVKDLGVLDGRKLAKIREEVEHHLTPRDRPQRQLFDDQRMTADLVDLQQLD